jgi:uncharacterized membrane protein
MSSQSYQLSFSFTVLLLIIAVFFIILLAALGLKAIMFIYKTLCPRATNCEQESGKTHCEQESGKTQECVLSKVKER